MPAKQLTKYCETDIKQRARIGFNITTREIVFFFFFFFYMSILLGFCRFLLCMLSLYFHLRIGVACGKRFCLSLIIFFSSTL